MNHKALSLGFDYTKSLRKPVMVLSILAGIRYKLYVLLASHLCPCFICKLCFFFEDMKFSFHYAIEAFVYT